MSFTQKHLLGIEGLAQSAILEILDKAEKILSRDIAVFDFRLPYRITLRFPENKDGQINSKVIGVSN